MRNTEAIDISHVKFTSAAEPTAEDMKLWDTLSNDEKIAVIDRDLAEAEASGIAEPETMAERIERVRKTMPV